MDWAAISSFATVILVIITGVYAFITYHMVKEMKAGRELQAIPILRCELESDLQRSIKKGNRLTFGFTNKLLIENIGISPAINLTVLVTQLDQPNSTWSIPTAKLSIGTLGMETKSIELPDTAVINPDAEVKGDIPAVRPGLKEPEMKITLEYQNVYKKKIKTVSIIAMQATQQAPMWEWKKIQEDITII